MWIIPAVVTLALTSLPSRALDPAAIAIEQAQALALRKNRTEACATLRRALASTPPTSARARLKEALGRLARLSFTDMGQRAYEAGQAELFENPDGAVTEFVKALTLEDGNLAVRAALARAYLIKGECAAAGEQTRLARELNPHDVEAALLEVRALVCQKEFDLARERVRALPPLDKWQEYYVLYLQAQDYLSQGATTKATEALGRVVAEFPKFPEARYDLARVERPRAAEVHLRRYVNLCQALGTRERRAFAPEPRLCAHQKEAEDELAKKSVDL